MIYYQRIGMKIFYIHIDEFKKIYGKDFLKPYADIELKSEKRFYEYTLGRYLAKQTAGEYYNVKNPQIITEANGKPVFKNANLHLSISHSKNIVMVCLDNQPCGIDIEYNKPRNFKKLSNHYKREFKSAMDFYEFWTLKEASFKLGCAVRDFSFLEFENEYYLTVTSSAALEKDFAVTNYLAR